MNTGFVSLVTGVPEQGRGVSLFRTRQHDDGARGRADWKRNRQLGPLGSVARPGHSPCLVPAHGHVGREKTDGTDGFDIPTRHVEKGLMR